MTTCANCGRENEEHYKFCLGCGANLDDQRAEAAEAPGAELKFCPSCGADVSPGQRFCGSCGFKLEAAPAAAAAPPEAEPPEPAPAEPEPARGPTPGPSVATAEPPVAATGDAVGALVMVNPDGSAGDSAPLRPGANPVGRESEHEVFRRDPFLSPLHATFHVDGESVRAVDEGSLNGVFYRVTEITELQHGDQVRIGQELLRFMLLDLDEPVVQGSDDGTVVAGSNPLGAWGKLERVSGPTEASFTFLLRGAEVVIGRERGDILFRDDGYVSGKHARVFQDSGRYFIEDLKSSNGTFVRLRGDRTLGNGSLILLGRQPFRIQLG